jgi:DNA-binding transcriptional ArsR family regulator
MKRRHKKKLNDSDFKVLALFSSVIDREGAVFLSNDCIAKKASVTTRAVSSALSKLEDHGKIKISREGKYRVIEAFLKPRGRNE